MLSWHETANVEEMSAGSHDQNFNTQLKECITTEVVCAFNQGLYMQAVDFHTHTQAVCSYLLAGTHMLTCLLQECITPVINYMENEFP